MFKSLLYRFPLIRIARFSRSCGYLGKDGCAIRSAIHEKGGVKRGAEMCLAFRQNAASEAENIVPLMTGPLQVRALSHVEYDSILLFGQRRCSNIHAIWSVLYD